MPHIITYTEEIEEHGYCQQRPVLRTGDKYLHEVDGQKRLRIVLSVHFDKYVWENVAQWTTTIEEFFEGEYQLKMLPMNIGTPQSYVDVPVFIANGLVGVLTCDQDKVKGDMKFNEVVPVMLHITALDDCENLPKFDRLFDRLFSGKYQMLGGDAFREWEHKMLCDTTFWGK